MSQATISKKGGQSVYSIYVSKEKKCLLSFSRKCSICMYMIHCSIQTYPVTVDEDEVYFFVFTTDDVALSSFPLQSIYVVKDVEKGAAY